MIVYNFEKLEPFLFSLSSRVSSEVFTQYVEPDRTRDFSMSSSGSHKLILQFIGRIDPTGANITILHQLSLDIKGSDERDEVIGSLKKAFDEAGGIRLIQGSINEVFTSLTS